MAIAISVPAGGDATVLYFVTVLCIATDGCCTVNAALVVSRSITWLAGFYAVAMQAVVALTIVGAQTGRYSQNIGLGQQRQVY